MPIEMIDSNQTEPQNAMQVVDQITLEDIEKSLPPRMRGICTAEVVSTLNSVIRDPEERAIYRANLMAYANVLKDISHITVIDYTNAVTFVMYLTTGMSKTDAYKKTFPFKKVSPAKIGTYASIYSRTKLVSKILEQMIVPLRILNLDAPQKALNVLIDLMNNAKSEKVRCDAADRVIAHLAPQENDVRVKVDVTESEDLKLMKEHLRQMAENQKELLNRGTVSLTQIVNTPSPLLAHAKY